MKKVCMLGSGAWGTAVSSLLADNGYEVNMWCFDPTVARDIQVEHCNKKFLPDITLNENIKTFTDISKAMYDVQWIFEATPVKFLRPVLQSAKPYVSPKQKWVVLSKGIENETLLFPSQMLDHVFETTVQKVVISGPSFAKDVARKQVTAVDIASSDEHVAKELCNMLTNNYFSGFITSDVRGVQLGGSLKNVLALAFGMLEGAGYGDNTKFFMLTIGLHEIATFAKFIKVEQKTIYGLSGLGDLMLTCAGKLSKNLMVGRCLGQGQSLEDIIKVKGILPEGVNTTKSVYEVIQHCRLETTFTYAHHAIWGDRTNLDQTRGIELPLFECMYEIIFGDKGVNDLVSLLSEYEALC